MSYIELDQLHTAIKRQWSSRPSTKARPYVNAFSAAERRGTKITGTVVGNHGTYTVSIQLDPQGLTSACRCYIGRHGHCEAFARTFLADPGAFKTLKVTQRQDIRAFTSVQASLQSVTLEAWLTPRKAKAQRTRREVCAAWCLRTSRLCRLYVLRMSVRLIPPCSDESSMKSIGRGSCVWKTPRVLRENSMALSVIAHFLGNLLFVANFHRDVGEMRTYEMEILLQAKKNFFHLQKSTLEVYLAREEGVPPPLFCLYGGYSLPI
jgi:hypothetical protein